MSELELTDGTYVRAARRTAVEDFDSRRFVIIDHNGECRALDRNELGTIVRLAIENSETPHGRLPWDALYAQHADELVEAQLRDVVRPERSWDGHTELVMAVVDSALVPSTWYAKLELRIEGIR